MIIISIVQAQHELAVQFMINISIEQAQHGAIYD